MSALAAAQCKEFDTLMKTLGGGVGEGGGGESKPDGTIPPYLMRYSANILYQPIVFTSFCSTAKLFPIENVGSNTLGLLFIHRNLHNGGCKRRPTLTDVGAAVQYESFVPTFSPQLTMKS